MDTINSSINSSIQSIEIINVSDLISLKEHKSAWNKLAETTSPYFPTCSYSFVSAFLEYSLEAHENWQVIFAYSNGKLVGVLPLIIKTRKKLGLTLTSLQTPSNDDTFGAAPLLLVGHEKLILSRLLDAAHALHKNVSYIEVSDVSSKLPLAEHSSGQLYIEISKRVGRYISTTGLQEEYQSSLSKNFRSNHKKAFNKLNKLPAISYEFIKANIDDSSCFEEFRRVEALSWKGKAGTAVKCSKSMTEFYQSLTKNLAENGWLEWQILKTEENIVAINLAIRFHRNIIVLKLGYDEAYSNCSPGGMLFQELINRSFNDESIDEIDIITDAKWYDDWKMQRREYTKIRYYSKFNIIALIVNYVPDVVKSFIRKNEALVKLMKKILKR